MVQSWMFVQLCEIGCGVGVGGEVFVCQEVWQVYYDVGGGEVFFGEIGCFVQLCFYYCVCLCVVVFGVCGDSWCQLVGYQIWYVGVVGEMELEQEGDEVWMFGL